MVSRNRDKISLGIGLTAGILAATGLILTCVGLSLPSWYTGNSANGTVLVAEANLFYSCFALNTSQGSFSSTLNCTSYSLFTCSTTSYQNIVLNTTAYISGCINPTNGSSVYLTYEGPIYQVTIDDFYSLRSAAALSILSILFILASSIFAFIVALIVLNIYVVFIGPILACLGTIFGICCLVLAGSVLNYTGTGLAVFAAGVLIEVIVTTLLGIAAGRLNVLEKPTDDSDNEPIYARRSNSPIVIRRVHKRRI